MSKRADTDHCRACGSGNLFSGFFDADDLATDTDVAPGTRWTTFCNECGAEQVAAKPRRARAPRELPGLGDLKRLL